MLPLGVLVCALVVVAARLPFLTSPLGSDEGGFLLVGSQWHAGGTSLYGDYWVDRPPLLIGFFALADALGGVTALRLLGCVAALAVVLLTHQLARAVHRSTSLWPVIAAAAFISMPLLGIRQVDGELLAVPFVVAGLALAVRADAATPFRIAPWAAAGVLGTAALMVKQNFVDVFVFGVVLLLARAVSDRASLRRELAAVGALLLGGVTSGGVALGLATTRGTTPASLWDALVVFRARAAHVISTYTTDVTPQRLRGLLLVLALSGGLLVIGAFAVHVVQRPLNPLVIATSALLGWELFAVVAGGSYWLHYLIGLIPGLVLTVSLIDSAPGRLRTGIRAVTAYALVATVVTSLVLQVRGTPRELPVRVSAWLADRVQPGDTGVILYGNPNMLWIAGLTSPYEQLWSLPVRVRDPDLAELTGVLRGPNAPTWVLAWNDPNTWVLSSVTADEAVAARYHLYAVVCGVEVFRLGHPHDPVTPAELCPA